MKVLILDLYYERFLASFYAAHPEIAGLDFQAHRARLMAERFSTSDAYSHFLGAQGLEAEELVANDARLQMKWARENGLRALPLPTRLSNALNVAVGWDWRWRILRRQVEKIRPDILYIQEQNILSDRFIAELKGTVRRVVCQISCPIPRWRTFRAVDLVVTAFPHYVPYFRDRGLKAEFVRLAFDPRMIPQGQPRPRTHALTFVGGLIPDLHRARLEMLERLAEQFPLAWFGYGSDRVEAGSALRRAARGEVWGSEMYRVLAESRVTVNAHGEVSRGSACNMRLYEATGMGACLVTDWKQDLAQAFEPEREVVAYRSGEELAEKVRRLLDHPEEARAIGARGQERTLREHTYRDRMAHLAGLLKSLL